MRACWLPATGMNGRLRVAVPLSIALIVTAVTWQRFSNGLAWDDPLILDALRRLVQEHRLGDILDHSTVSIVLERDAGVVIDLYRPLVLFSFAAVEGLFGREPVWQHTCNLLLHLGCVWLVYGLAQRRPFSLSWPWAAFASLWFGLMPALGEAHLWISGRFDLMATLFVLCAVRLQQTSAEAQARAVRAGAAAAAGLTFLASLLSKEASALVVVALAFLPDRNPIRARLRSLAPFVAALIAYGVIRGCALGFPRTAQPNDLRLMLLHAGGFVLDGVQTVLLPRAQYMRAPLEDYRALGPAWLAALAVVFAGLCVLVFRARKRQPALAWSWLWFVLALAPAVLVTAVSWPGFGRYLYLPSSLFLPGVLTALRGWVEARPALSPKLRLAAAATYLGTCALWLSAYATDWKDSETIYTAIVRAAPERSHGWGFLGIAALEHGRYAQAADLLRRASQIAPFEARYVPPLARALLFTGRTAEAQAVAEAAARRWPEQAQYRLLVAHAYVRDEPERAAEFILQCLRIDRENEECRDALRFLAERDPRSAQLAPTIARNIEREPDPSLRGELARMLRAR